MGSVLNTVGSKLVERWIAVIVVPAFIFWAGGLFILYIHDDATVWGWGVVSLLPNHGQWQHVDVADLFPATTTTVSDWTWALVAVLVVFSSGVIAQRFVLPMLRWIEGYWPRWLEPVNRYFATRRATRTTASRQRLDELRARYAALTPEELAEYAQLDYRLTRVPSDPKQQMPTKVGDILRAAETRPQEKYGLSVLVCWPRLWLVLPDTAKAELTAARANLNTGTVVLFWSLLFSVWAWWAWWAALVAGSAPFSPIATSSSPPKRMAICSRAPLTCIGWRCMTRSVGHSRKIQIEEKQAGQRLTAVSVAATPSSVSDLRSKQRNEYRS